LSTEPHCRCCDIIISLCSNIVTGAPICDSCRAAYWGLSQLKRSKLEGDTIRHMNEAAWEHDDAAALLSTVRPSPPSSPPSPSPSPFTTTSPAPSSPAPSSPAPPQLAATPLQCAKGTHLEQTLSPSLSPYLTCQSHPDPNESAGGSETFSGVCRLLRARLKMITRLSVDRGLQSPRRACCSVSLFPEPSP